MAGSGLIARGLGFEARSPDGGHTAASSIDLAAIWMKKAWTGSTRWVDHCSARQLQWYSFRKQFTLPARLVRYAYLLLAIFERPSWCLREGVPCADERSDMYSSMLTRLPVPVSNSFEIVCLLLFLLQYDVRRRSLGAAHKFGWWQIFGSALILVSLLDCVVGAFNTVGIVPTSLRLARLCRPLIVLAMTKPLRRAANRVLRSITSFLDVLASLVICVFSFVWIGLLLFARTEEGWERFDSWGDALASIWILFTTANCPDVMMKALNRNLCTFLFFFVYLVLSLYLLNNVLLAAVYNSYKEQLRATLILNSAKRETAIERSFALLAGSTSGQISCERWTAFFFAFSAPSKATAMDTEDKAFLLEKSNAIFQLLDVDESQGLDLEVFKLCAEVLLEGDIYRTLTPQRRIKRPWARVCRRVLLRGVRIRGRHVHWDNLVDCLILMELLAIFVQTIIFVSAELGGGRFNDGPLEPRAAFSVICFVFSCFYTAEVSLKIGVLGPQHFCHRKPLQHRFDFFNVYALFALEVVTLVCARPPSEQLRLLVLLRLARALRLLRHIKPLKHMALLFMRLVPAYWELGSLLFLVYYIYATVGEQIFGGLISTSTTALHNSDFEKGEYWALNFNDFVSGTITLFVLMVVNNWYIIADAFIKVTGTVWTALYFVSFFVVTNLIVLNILVALILDCFTTMKSELEQKHAMHARFDSEDSTFFDDTTPNTNAAPQGALRRSQSFGPSVSFGRAFSRMSSDDSTYNDDGAPNRGAAFGERTSVRVGQTLNAQAMLRRVLNADLDVGEDLSLLRNMNQQTPRMVHRRASQPLPGHPPREDPGPLEVARRWSVR